VYCTVTCDGVPIGATELEGWGVRAAWLTPLPAYAEFNLSAPARRLGIALLAVTWRRVPSSVANHAFRAASEQAEALEPRLGLLNVAGASVPAPRIALVDMPRRSPLAGTYVIADLGEEGAARAALRPSPPVNDRGRSRPAA
jgi:hypothetical protein